MTRPTAREVLDGLWYAGNTKRGNVDKSIIRLHTGILTIIHSQEYMKLASGQHTYISIDDLENGLRGYFEHGKDNI